MSIYMSETDLEIINFLEEYGQSESYLLALIFQRRIGNVQNRLNLFIENNLLKRFKKELYITNDVITDRFVYYSNYDKTACDYPNDFYMTRIYLWLTYYNLKILKWVRHVNLSTICKVPLLVVIFDRDGVQQYIMVDFALSHLESKVIVEKYLHLQKQQYYRKLNIDEMPKLIILTPENINAFPLSGLKGTYLKPSQFVPYITYFANLKSPHKLTNNNKELLNE